MESIIYNIVWLFLNIDIFECHEYNGWPSLRMSLACVSIYCRKCKTLIHNDFTLEN